MRLEEAPVEAGSRPVLLTTRSIMWVLSGAATLFVALSVAGQYVSHVLGFRSAFGFVHQFYLGEADNVATYFAALLTLAASALLFVASRSESHGPLRHYWQTLALIFFALAGEEAVRFSFLLDRIITAVLNRIAPGFSYRIVWVVLELALAAWFLPFLRALPRRTCFGLLAAAFLYVPLAAFIELVGRIYGYSHGYVTFGFTLFSTAEEAVELAGVLVLIHTLLRYGEQHVRVLHLRFGSEGA